MEKPAVSAVSELESNLQAMLGLKAPGVSTSKVAAITSLCVSNVQVGLETFSPSLTWSVRAANALACRGPTVRICAHPEDLHSLQKGAADP